MSYQQVVHRLVWSIIVVGVAFSLSCTASATEAHRPITKSLANYSPSKLTNPAVPHPSPQDTSIHSGGPSCATCNSNQNNPTVVLIFMAAVTSLLVMFSLIYGFGFIVRLTMSPS